MIEVILFNLMLTSFSFYFCDVVISKNKSGFDLYVKNPLLYCFSCGTGVSYFSMVIAFRYSESVIVSICVAIIMGVLSYFIEDKIKTFFLKIVESKFVYFVSMFLILSCMFQVGGN